MKTTQDFEKYITRQQKKMEETAAQKHSGARTIKGQ
jgi:hypothetical protein